MDIELKPRKVARFLFILAGVFTLLHITGRLAAVYLGSTITISLFDFDGERSFPRFYSEVILLLCSCLLLIIAGVKNKDNNHSFIYWLGLALIFLCAAIMKNTAIHEYLAALILSAFNMSKIQFYAWVYITLFVVFPLVYLKFLLNLPRKSMVLFIIGGLTFLAGGFGLDLILAFLGKLISHNSVAYIGLDTLEGVLEMAGVIVFIYALMSYMGLDLKWIRLRITE